MFYLFIFVTTAIVAGKAASLENLEPQVDLQIDSKRIRDGLIHCKCSPTDAVPNKFAVLFMNDTLSKLQHSGGSKNGHTVHATKIMLRSNTNSTRVSLTTSKLTQCENQYSYTDCINADKSLRDVRNFNFSLCTYDYVTELNEGCIAINHLRGYKLLYTKHIWTEMYCYKDAVCATPNHAIIFKGTYTSLKIVCANPLNSINCSRKYGWVNNLRVSGRYELNLVKVNDEITITPFDARFPRWTVYIAQGIWITQNYVRAIIAHVMVPLVFTSIMLLGHYRHVKSC